MSIVNSLEKRDGEFQLPEWTMGQLAQEFHHVANVEYSSTFSRVGIEDISFGYSVSSLKEAASELRATADTIDKFLESEHDLTRQCEWVDDVMQEQCVRAEGHEGEHLVRVGDEYDQWTAPFTEEQVQALNRRQEATHLHPYTCGNDSTHGLLKPETNGLRCPDCEYLQGWSHDESWFPERLIGV